MSAEQYTRYTPRSAWPVPDAGSFTIRFASMEDIPGLTTLFDAYRMFYGRASGHRAAGEFLAARVSAGESTVLVAVRQRIGEIVGFAQLFRGFSSLALGAVIVLNDLFVIPSTRRHGVGGRLVDAAIEYARQTGALRVDLEAHPENAAAMRLYREKGFVVDEEFVHLSVSLRA